MYEKKKQVVSKSFSGFGHPHCVISFVLVVPISKSFPTIEMLVWLDPHWDHHVDHKRQVGDPWFRYMLIRSHGIVDPAIIPALAGPILPP